MGIEQGFMEYLSTWEEALDSPAELAVLRKVNRRTPASFKREDVFPREDVKLAEKGADLTAGQCALLAAVALVDAVDLRCPGTDEGKAIQLVESLFELQAVHGFMCLGQSRSEVLSPTQAPLWEAGLAAVLYVAWERKIEGLLGVVSAWWRQYLDLCGAHAVDNSILTPCQRGADAKHPRNASSADRGAIFAFVTYGLCPVKDLTLSLLGARFFQSHLSDVPLPLGHFIPLPAPLHFLRYVDGFVSWFPILPGLNVQWMVGTTRQKPEGAIDVRGGWAVLGEKGGTCPVQPPPGWTSEKIYPAVNPPAED